MSEQDWAHKICEEIFLEYQMKTGLPSSYTLQKAVIKALHEARKIEWPSENTIKEYCLTESPESALRITRFFLWLQKYVETGRK